MTSKLRKAKILIFIDWFWPGFKAGGPISAAVNFVNHMQNDYEVYIFTTDRDLNSTISYPNITSNKWVAYSNLAQVYYSSPEKLGWKKIQAVILEIAPKFIYLNSLFSKFFTIYPLLIHRKIKSSAKIVLAPRGMLRASALQFKSSKKKIYLALFKRLQLPRAVFFQATDTIEYNDIKLHFGQGVNVSMAADFPAYVGEFRACTAKSAGELKIVFVGRLHPIKQLDFLLRLLPGLPGSFLLTVVGAAEDKAYTENCKKLISSFASGIRVIFKGGVPSQDLPAIFIDHHIFALPTQGENFGHAIFEALSHGKPALISNQTPWRDLSAHKAGWDLPLDQPELFKKALLQATKMDQQQYDDWSQSAWRFAKNYTEQADLISAYKKIFT